jgi:hypothetical protein
MFNLRQKKLHESDKGSRGDSPRGGNAQGQIGKTEFKIDLRRGEGRKLNFSLISLKKGQTLEKVLLFLTLIFLVNGINDPTSNLTQTQ